MPTLKRRADTTTVVHPRQTPYYILANPPDVGNITYQVDERAAAFLTETCDYGDDDSLPWSLVHPLRQIRDLFTLDEGRPREQTDDETHERVTVPELESQTRSALVTYLQNHPDIRGDIGSFETKLAEGDGEYAGEIRRVGYTPASTPGHDSTNNETLDRIADRYFGEGTADYITWNGERHYEYIEVETREGDTHRFPKLDRRLPEGERLRLSRELYTRWGQQIGESDVVSRRYEPGQEGFPNRWIGQRAGAPSPSLEHADSPRAFYYRTIAGRSGFAPGSEAEEAFADACDYSLQVYKANFPRAVDPNDLRTEYVTVEEATRPWNDFQVPPGWIDRYADNGGLPPLKRTETTVSKREQAVIDRHVPAGDGPTWFETRDEAVDLVTNTNIGDYLLGASESDQQVSGFHLGGYGQPIFEVDLDDATMTVEIDSEMCRGEIPSTTGGTHDFWTDDGEIAGWERPATANAEETHSTLAEQARYFPAAATFADAVVGRD